MKQAAWNPQGLKPRNLTAHRSARLKPCPDTKPHGAYGTAIFVAWFAIALFALGPRTLRAQDCLTCHGGLEHDRRQRQEHLRGPIEVQLEHSRQPGMHELPRRHQGLSASREDCAGGLQDLPRGPGGSAQAERARRQRGSIPAPAATATRTKFILKPTPARRSIRSTCPRPAASATARTAWRASTDWRAFIRITSIRFTGLR